MRNLISDLLAYGEITHVHDRFESVDLNEVAKEVLEDLEIIIDRNDAKVIIEQPLPTIIADKTQMRQLWQNLISNAIKYKKKDQSSLIQIRYKKVSGKWEFEVEDNGIGFDIKYLDKMIKPFQRLNTQHRVEGTGIGLAICRKIVSQHGGVFTARSEIGKGSTFIFQLGRTSH